MFQMDRITIVSSCEAVRGTAVYNKDYEKKAIRLVHSIRENGGKYKDANIVMWYAGEVAPSHNTFVRLKDMGCVLVEGETYIPEDPVANKMTACCVPNDSKYTMWMDSDMYVLGTTEFESLIELNTDFAAVSTEYSFHRWASSEEDASWAELYKLAGVDKPTEKFITGLDGGEGTFYFNSALVLFRNGMGFPEEWRRLGKLVRFSGIDKSEHNFTQTSLTLAVLRVGCTYKQLPQTYNAYYALQKEDSLNCAILHYQDNVINDTRVVWNV